MDRYYCYFYFCGKRLKKMIENGPLHHCSVSQNKYSIDIPVFLAPFFFFFGSVVAKISKTLRGARIMRVKFKI